MGIKRRIAGALVVLAVAGIAVSAAAGAHRTDPGITANSITIGGTFPLTGVAAAYKTIPLAEQAYYAYVNAHGGVNGRDIDFKVLDDAYNPAQTVPLTQQLVEQSKVFAVVGSLGTAPGLSTWTYLNQKQVPQVFLATGDSYWGACEKKSCAGSTHPYTIGWQPDYPAEGRMYGKYIAQNMPNAKVGIIYQNDAFGKNYIAGLVQGLGAKKSLITDEEGFNATDTTVTQQILALKAKGCDTLFIVATPSQAIASLVTATKIGWSPTTFLSNVSNNPFFVHIAGANGANLDGVISSVYTANQTTQATLPGMVLGRQIISGYAGALLPQWDAGDGNLVYGLGVAWTFVQALQQAGKNPTRASFLAAVHNLNTSKNPFLYPGISLKTSATDGFPIEQLQLVKWSGGATGNWQAVGSVQNVGH
ncbi:MAG: ABC transporter substrate-binding protein [Actinobacteria bacterium]|nr:ABC transporter substrate-binding protein [Actinomycetota bacterium]